MRQLDHDTAERLLDGVVTPDDAPPGYRLVARLIAALRAPEPLREPRRTRAAARTSGQPAVRTSRSGHRQFAVLAVVLAGILTLGLASAGALPGPVQRIAATVLEHAGVPVPGSGQHPADGSHASSDPRPEHVAPKGQQGPLNSLARTRESLRSLLQAVN